MSYRKCLTYSLHNLLHVLYQRCDNNISTPIRWMWIAANLFLLSEHISSVSYWYIQKCVMYNY